MKKYAFFQGCNIPARIEQYATSTTAVLQKFGIDLVGYAAYVPAAP